VTDYVMVPREVLEEAIVLIAHDISDGKRRLSAIDNLRAALEAKLAASEAARKEAEKDTERYRKLKYQFQCDRITPLTVQWVSEFLFGKQTIDSASEKENSAIAQGKEKWE
jgi:hypothetical protein